MTAFFETNEVWLLTLAFSDRLHLALLEAREELKEGLISYVGSPTRDLVILDDGGPGGPGDIFVSLAQRYSAFPVFHVSSAEVPAFIDESSVVVLFDLGYDDELMTDAAYAGVTSGARLVCFSPDLSSGTSKAVRESGGFVQMVHRPSPSDIPGLAELLAPGMVLLEAIGAFPTASAWMLEAANELKSLTPALAGSGRRAHQLAQQVGRTIPLFIGTGILGEAAARAWKSCYNMTCRSPAFTSSLGDALSVEVHGWGLQGDVTRQLFSVVLLRQDDEHPEVRITGPQLLETLREVTHVQEIVTATANGPLTQFLELLLLGQLVALYRAESEGLEPSFSTCYRM